MNTEADFEHSLPGDYMCYQSAARSKSLAGISMNGKLVGMFVENEVLLNLHDAEGIALLVDRFGGKVIEPRPIPERPYALDGSPARDISGK